MLLQKSETNVRDGQGRVTSKEKEVVRLQKELEQAVFVVEKKRLSQQELESASREELAETARDHKVEISILKKELHS